MIERVISAILYGLVGYILSEAGLTFDTWQFLVVIVSMVGVQLLHPVAEAMR